MLSPSGLRFAFVQGNSDAERMVKFLAIMVTRQDEEASEQEREEAEEFLEQVLTFLVGAQTTGQL